MNIRFIASAAAALWVSAFAGSAWAQSTPLPPKGWAPEGSPVAMYGQLKVSGTEVQSEKTNAAVQLRGMSFGWTSDATELMKSRDFYNERVVAWLASDWRVSLVRAAMGVSDKAGPMQVEGLPYKGNELVHKNLVKTLANSAIWQGIYVIIDWHSHHAHSGEEPAAAKAFFGEMAQIYKDYPNVIYEIYNEPISASWDQVKSYATGVIDEIRKYDPKNLIIVGTPSYSSRVDQANSSPITGKTNIAYAMHFYCDHSDNTNQGQVPFSSASNIPIFASEFGTSKSSGDGTCSQNFSETSTWLGKLDTKKVSWANWQINTRNEASSALKYYSNSSEYQRLQRGKWTTSDLSASGAWIRDRLRSYGGSDRKYKVDIEIEGQGTASGGSNISVCDEVSLTATPTAGSRFEGWIFSGVSNSNNPYKLEVCYDKVGKAVFFPDNLIKNSTFTVLEGWAKQPASGTTGTVPDMASVDGELVFTMPTEVGSEAFAIRAQHGGTSLTQGKKYKLTFEARATKARTMQAAFRTASNTPSGHKLNIGQPVSLTTTKNAFELEFGMCEPTTTTGVIAFYFGGQSGNVTIDNVKLEDVGSYSGECGTPPDPCAGGQPTTACCAVNPTFAGCGIPPNPCDAGPTTECCAVNSAFPGCPGTGVKFPAVRARSTVWSIARVGGALQLRGPTEVGATVSLYDVRGKMVRNMAAKDGLSLSVGGLPAGSYIVVVKNRVGKEVLRTKAVMAK